MLSWLGINGLNAGQSHGQIFLALALSLLLGALGFLASRLGRSVRVTPERLVFEAGSKKTVILWSDLKKFYPPSSLQHHFRTARISDGTNEIQLDSLSFAEFDLLVNLISVARKNKTSDKDATYELR